MTEPVRGTRRVLRHGHATIRPRFEQPVVIKQGNMFLLTNRGGDVLPDSDQGLYFRDMRYLCEAVLRIDGMPAVPLLTNTGDGSAAVFGLTNPELGDPTTTMSVRKETIGIRRDKRLGDGYEESLTLENYGAQAAHLTLTLDFDADFVDMFQVRGVQPERRGTLQPPRWRGNTLTLQYDGADGHGRSITLEFSHAPDRHREGHLAYDLVLERGKRWELHIEGALRDQQGSQTIQPRAEEGASLESTHRAHEGQLVAGARIETDNSLFNEILARSFMDLHMLSMRQEGQSFFAAGVPWYVALFGRDSLLTAIQVAAYEPRMAAHTLRVLAERQATKLDDLRDAQPGKILHELRVGEMANLNEVPQTPYYGTVDATPLFLILLGIASAWTGTLDLFKELRDHVDAALAWIDQYGDSDGDGFVDYKTRSSMGLRNQGWKDSGNGVVMEDGRLAEPPIALPEVQGEVFLAWSMMAELYERAGDQGTADELSRKARVLYEAFNQQFWLPEQRYYAFCRQADGRFSKSIASNAAHALWTGIVDAKRAGAVVRRVLEADMFSGWGIRTLATSDVSYNPVDYQVGSIWPHDNSFIMAGMQHYGFGEEACQLFTAMLDTASKFENYRLPETFSGFDRAYSNVPVQYPVACSPQAWAAGSIPFMMQMSLGLHPDGFHRRLRVERPCLSAWLKSVTVKGLRVGEAEVDLRYERSGDTTLVAVVGKHGDLTISIEY
ncbi:MAG: hypothetical protein QOF51_1617 [Chloroflexota bacterium]|nr:hypothetical protein [Chloroflexota bacterium]